MDVGSRSSGGRILVVDDERSLRHLLKVYLAKEGFEVAEAATGEQALSLLRGGRVDLALVDVMLPELDSLEVVRRIRTLAALSRSSVSSSSVPASRSSTT
jgi:DNA-binding response OmpR family regulator